MKNNLILITLFITLIYPDISFSKKKKINYSIDSLVHEIGEWRNIGPFRGGRSTASTRF